jgi:hypothetical protein
MPQPGILGGADINHENIRIVGVQRDARKERLLNPSPHSYHMRHLAQLGAMLEGTVWNFRIYEYLSIFLGTNRLLQL